MKERSLLFIKLSYNFHRQFINYILVSSKNISRTPSAARELFRNNFRIMFMSEKSKDHDKECSRTVVQNHFREARYQKRL